MESTATVSYNRKSEEAGCSLPNFYLPQHQSWPLPKYILPGSRFGKRFYRSVGDPASSAKYYHEIRFTDEGFTVDGEFRQMTDPKYLPFLESLDNLECPKEFSAPGEHCITILGDLSFNQEAVNREAKSRVGATKAIFNMGGRMMGNLNNVNF